MLLSDFDILIVAGSSIVALATLSFCFYLYFLSKRESSSFERITDKE